MVVFTCNNCGESLQKPRVEKHYFTVCRSAKNLTCVDCFKDFRNEEYQVHTKCVTEEERYAAKGAYPNSIQKKGAVKQDNWFELVSAALNSANISSASQSKIVETILASANVPRKKIKFVNFIKSACGNRTTTFDIEAVWNIIEDYKEKQNQTVVTKPQVEDKKTEESIIKQVINNVVNGDTPKEKQNLNGSENARKETKELTVELIKNALKAAEICTTTQKKLVKKLLKLDNIPIKRKKFIKFVQSEIDNVEHDDILALWEIVDKSTSEESEVCNKKNGVQEENMELIPPNTNGISGELVKNLLKSANISGANQKKLIEKISTLDYIPSKKKKFIKLIQKKFENTELSDIQAVWDLMKNDEKNTTENLLSESKISENGSQNGVNDDELDKNVTGDITIIDSVKSMLQKRSFSNPGEKNIKDFILKQVEFPLKNFKKFSSFIRKQMETSQPKDIQLVWNIIQDWKNINLPAQTLKRKASDMENEEVKDNCKKVKLENQTNEKKLKSAENDDVSNKPKTGTNNSETRQILNFPYEDAICEILNKHDTLSLIKLEKKILKKYSKKCGQPSKNITKKLNRQLTQMPNILIQNGIVKIIVD